MPCCFFFFFNDTATTEIYTLSLHDALPILILCIAARGSSVTQDAPNRSSVRGQGGFTVAFESWIDRKSTRLNSSHDQISYAVFCLKKKNTDSSVTPTEHKTTKRCQLADSRL